MAELKINQDKVVDHHKLVGLCPFQALYIDESGDLALNDRCKFCKLCLKFSAGAIELVEETEPKQDFSGWKDLAVYLECQNGKIHPIAWELVGKALELAKQLQQRVWGVLIGMDLTAAIAEAKQYGLDDLVIYEAEELRYFRIEPYTAAWTDFIMDKKPNIILMGATNLGRSLAARLAAGFSTGLTADCTVLRVESNGALVQIRPAFGGNIMAQIKTPGSRPQMATVRYKVMQAALPNAAAPPKIEFRQLSKTQLASAITLLRQEAKPPVRDISDAEVILAVGRGVKRQEDLKLIRQLADRLNASLAFSRPMIEAGWADARQQIGLSGRTVKPKLLIALGISGSVQFVAGMSGSGYTIAVNTDAQAPIFQVAHLGLVGDYLEFVGELSAILDEKAGV
ncbi:MAG: electron transfer flavoprotein subunit alpha/FixB family protein [Negativicutes bacterium]|nr:electron transfer flavoprotein subunit alpha/FixB family protein [Negativicutes bacterium]